MSTLSFYSGGAQAVQWNGYGNQFNFRMTGGNNVTYWYHGSTYSNSYHQAFDYALLSWSQPRVNGAPDPATRCTPDNAFSHTYTPNISYAEAEMYALPQYSGLYVGANGYAAFYINYRPYEMAVNPDLQAYGWGQAVLNTLVMDSRPLLSGVGSKRTVASHEVGHVLGLAHRQVAGTVMAQQSYRTVIGATCTDNNSLRQRW